MTTFLQHAKATLALYALSTTQIDNILSRVMSSPANDQFTGRWGDNTSDYPVILTFIFERVILREALDYMTETLPDAWMIPALRDSIAG